MWDRSVANNLFDLSKSDLKGEKSEQTRKKKVTKKKYKSVCWEHKKYHKCITQVLLRYYDMLVLYYMLVQMYYNKRWLAASDISR